MPSQEWTGFLTGLMSTTAEGIKDKKDKADQYLQDQLDLARTRGLAAKDKRDSSMNAALTVAKQLVQVGVPRDLVMSIANQNPDDLPTFLEQVQGLQTEGVPIGPDTFKQMFKSAGSFKAPDEDLGTFFKRIYEPLRANVKNDPEGFKKDPHGGLWATMMGHNAMELAGDKVDNTEIFNGETAGDLIRGSYQSELNHPFGDSTVTMDAGVAGQAIRDAKEARKTEDPLSPSETKAVYDFYTKAKDEARLELQKAGTKADPDNFDISMIPEQEVVRRAGQKMITAGFGRFLSTIPEIVAAAGGQASQANTSADVPDTGGAAPQATMPPTEPTGQATVPSIPSPPPVAPQATEAPAGPTAPLAPNAPQQLPNGQKLVRDKGDGTSIWVDEQGHKFRYRNEEINSISQ